MQTFDTINKKCKNGSKMRKNEQTKLIAFFVAVFSLLFSIPAKAQWALPANVFNLPNNFDNAVVNVTNWILGFVTMIAVLMLIWGGISYLTSAGDEQKAEKGKKVINYALIGLVLAGFAYAIVTVIVTIILV